MEYNAHPALRKVRRICFASLPPPNLTRALKLLGSMDRLEAGIDEVAGCLAVRYDLNHHTLELLENRLTNHGYHLDNSLLQKIKRALIYYSESCQLENLRAPTREQRMRSVYLSSAHRPEHSPDSETEEYLGYCPPRPGAPLDQTTQP